MSSGSTAINPLRRLLDLLPSDPLLIGSITSVHGDGTATVTLSGGTGLLRVRNPQAITSGDVFVQGGQITGSAPSLPTVFVDIP